MLVMHRNKFGHQYYTLVGGGIDPGELAQAALKREVREESGIQIGAMRPIFVEHAGKPYGTQFIYLCEYVGGEPILSANSDEAKIHAMGQNLYTPAWLPIAQLAKVPFLSTELQHQLVDAFEHGFPDQPITYTSSATYNENAGKEY